MILEAQVERSISPLALGIVSDEISPDFHQALEHGLNWGISRYELRNLTSGRIPNVDTAEIEDVLKQVARYRVMLSALSPGIFKHSLSKSAELEKELSDTLPRTMEIAKKFGTRLIIVFGFQRERGEPDDRYHRAVELMRKATAIAERGGMRLAVENEPGFWCDSGENTAKLIRDVGSKSLGANWDPCNGYGTAEIPYPDGYRAIKEFIFNVHVKDTTEGALVRCVPVGEGAIDWKGQLNALVQDRPVEHITIETHCLPLIEKSRQNVETLRRMLSQIPTAAGASA